MKNISQGFRMIFPCFFFIFNV